MAYIFLLMRRSVVIAVGALAMVALVVQIAVADPVSREAAAQLTHKQVLRIALREAAHSRDPHPKRIEMATGSPRAALYVMEPRLTSGSDLGEEEVDLVVMHGRFEIDGSHPPHSRIAPGKVMELIVGAHTGFVTARSLSDHVPVPLSHLGPVTRLR
jgi:hypothetical protein